MRFRLVVYDTDKDNKYSSSNRYEFLGDHSAIWFLWYTMTKVVGFKHVEVFNLQGDKLSPERGMIGMIDYTP